MLRVEKNTEDAAKRGWRLSVKNDHGKYIVNHGKIMEFCFLNFCGNPAEPKARVELLVYQ